MIAALFVERGGVYWDLPGVDAWDEQRDARLYAGPWPVVAHPPCARWSKLAHIHKHVPGREIGNDNGCFETALEAVRKWGGVLEHPEGSAAWRAFGLQSPSRAWRRTVFDAGWVAEVEQGNYGHRARKATWLYAFGVVPPSLDWSTQPGQMTVDFMSGKGKERRSTPLPFRDLLLSIAAAATPRRKAR
jgi:hypothetical protein